MKVDPTTPGSHTTGRDPGPATSARASSGLRWAILAARLVMAVIFIYASIDKISHPAAFAKDVYNYQILPEALINLTALALPWLELLLGLCLVAGIWLPGAVLAVNGLLLVFFAALVFNLARGLDVDCGCFSRSGQGPPLSTGWYLLRDVGFLAVGFFLFYAVFYQRRVQGRPIVEAAKESS